jgi:hypothetical protein
VSGQPPVDRRLLGVHVEAGSRHLPALEGLEQRLVVDQLAARGVHDADALLGLGQQVLADEVFRLRREHRVQRDEVGGLDQLFEGEKRDVHRFRHGRRDEGIVGDDLHAERTAAGRDLASDAAEADHPQPLALQLDAGERLAVPLAGLHRGVGGGDVAREGEHHREGQLRGRHHVALR